MNTNNDKQPIKATARPLIDTSTSVTFWMLFAGIGTVSIIILIGTIIAGLSKKS